MKDRHVVAVGHELFDDVPADESAPTDHENAHAGKLPTDKSHAQNNALTPGLQGVACFVSCFPTICQA